MNKANKIMLLIAITLFSCARDGINKFEVVSYPLNLSFDSVGSQGFPFGWDFRFPAFLGFDSMIETEGLRLVKDQKTDQAHISYLLPGIYVEDRLLSLNLPYQLNSKMGRPTLSLIVHRDFGDSEVIEATYDSSQSLLRVDDLNLPRGMKELEVRISFSGPIDLLLKPMTITLDGIGVSDLSIDTDGVAEFESLRNSASPFSNVEGEMKYGNLIQSIKNKFILLGESTHGAQAFHEFKVNFTREMAVSGEKLVVAVEDDMFALIDLFNKPEVDVADFKKAMYTVWTSNEFFDFVKWARDNSDKVFLTGVDVQNPRAPLRYLNRFLGENDFLAKIQNMLEEKSFSTLDSNELERLYSTIKNIKAPVSLGEKMEYSLFNYAKTTLINSLKLFNQPSQEMRDEMMAENLKWLGDLFPERRVVFWGHDGHVRINEGATGGFLKIKTGDVFSVSVQTLTGSHKAYGRFNDELGWGESPLIDLPTGALGRSLWNALGEREGFLNLRKLTGENPDVLDIWRPVRSIGATALDLGINSWKVDASVYDALVILGKTNPIETPMEK